MTALWRISRHCDLEGLGGERSPGRWHTPTRGKRIVYLSEHPAVALLEVLVNLKSNPNLIPDRYQLMKVTLPPDLTVPQVAPLPDDWRDNPLETRRLGDTWLSANSSALLAVPSAPSPESLNYLFNPKHPEARLIATQWCKWLAYDRRLFQTSAHQ